LKKSLFLALDIGTSSVRSALYDGAAEVLPETMVKNERTVEITEDGGAEIDANEAFAQVVQAIDDVFNKCPAEVAETEYVAASCFWHSLIGIDEKGAPTTPVYTWAETRAADFVQKLRDDLNEEEIHNRTGARFHSSFWTGKLLWLRNEKREIFDKTAKWLSFSNYVALKLFGEAKTSVSMASGTGIFDIRKNDWDSELLDYLKIKRENLAEIVEKDDQTFQLNKEYSKRWEKLKSAKWFLAIGDGAANNIGANCLKKEKAALMIGTSGAMRVAFEGEVPDKIPGGLWCYRIDRKRLIMGGALSDGGGLYFWLKKNFRLKKNDDKTELKIAKRTPAGHGITFLPFLAGERSTGYHEDASGAMIGLKSAHDKIDIVQAALESVAYRFAEIYDQLNEVAEIKEIIASGGALRESPVWTQIICDVLAQNMNLPDTREASSRGAILLALETAGKIDKIEELATPKGEEFKFNQENHQVYKKARERHQRFYKILM
jgi:gluconokinase